MPLTGEAYHRGLPENLAFERRDSLLSFTIQGDQAVQRELNLLLTSKQKFCFGLAWQAWPGQSGTFVLKSTGGLAQAAWSHCTEMVKKAGSEPARIRDHANNCPNF